ncbi:inositol monophosphatase 2-like [Sitophilus oryzae]|uniref:Inositol-1-monophosphatase n=1 Tax=Sitophilus oryzae TaxID=7048 RepID=A0A6J2Y4D7_SITOR|nr:inositol monophosphatase 2-like [Sitophilus oryzae]XP_030758147.1 inositol monophosphatase 2-like [Sitophilus oryzae]
MDKGNVQSYMDFVLPLVLASGKELLTVEDINVEIKDGNVWDIVTEYDRKIEKLLIQKLKKKYPDHKFIGEEESAEKNCISTLTASPTWIIDPIDGTANFVKRMPLTCISVGLTIDKEQVLGVVYNAYANELFTAVKDQGAYLNGKRLKTSGLTEIDKSIFNYEISLAIKNTKLRKLYMSRLNHLIDKVSGIRSYGCAALGLCYVACGRVDAYQCDGLYPWDAAAGTLIVREAGGYVTDSSGKEFDLMQPNFLAASSKELSDQFMAIERQADEEATNKIKNHFLPEQPKLPTEKIK